MLQNQEKNYLLGAMTVYIYIIQHSGAINNYNSLYICCILLDPPYYFALYGHKLA